MTRIEFRVCQMLCLPALQGDVFVHCKNSNKLSLECLYLIVAANLSGYSQPPAFSMWTFYVMEKEIATQHCARALALITVSFQGKENTLFFAMDSIVQVKC